MALISVGAADCQVSKDTKDILIARALGSCIALLMYDPVAKVAGLLHYMLPNSSLDADQVNKQPYMFADTGIPLLLHRTCQLGAMKSRAVFIAAGGARMLDRNGTLNVGSRNYDALQKTLQELDILLYRKDVRGTGSRTLQVDIASGIATISRLAGPRKKLVVDLNEPKVGAIP